MSLFTEQDHARLATLFDGRLADGITAAGPYAGYRPEVREAPNGDTKLATCTACNGTGNQHRITLCSKCDGVGHVNVPNVDAGSAGKRFLHVALKYNPPAWAEAYLARAHWEASKVAQALGVRKEYFPMPADGTLRVLEYPSAGHDCTPVVGGIHDGLEKCLYCGAVWGPYVGNVCGSAVCPVLAPGAGTVEHTDFDLFTIVLWRSHPADLLRDLVPGGAIPGGHERRAHAEALSPGLHIGELGELVGLGPATPHRVPARPYAQKSIVYFAIPDHAATLPEPYTFPGRDGRGPVTVYSVGGWLRERIARSRYT